MPRDLPPLETDGTVATLRRFMAQPPNYFATRAATPKGMPKKRKSEINFKTTPMQEVFPVHMQGLSPTKILDFATYHPKWFESSYKFIDRNVHVGLEVEMENVLKIDPQLPLCFWQIAQDGSLRNNGFEFKTYPVSLQYVEPALKQLFDSVNDTIDFSKRTSVHVHIDVRQLSMSQILSIIYAYSVLENLLFKYAGTTRRNSIFCVPITETSLLRSFHTDPIQGFLTMHNQWQKYTALNIVPISGLGTLEFRQMPGTTNIQQILVWCDMLSRLRVFAYRYPLETIVEQIAALNTSSQYLRFVEDVLGELTIYLDTSNLLKDMEKACYLIKHAAHQNPFDQKIRTAKLDPQSTFGQRFVKEKPFTPEQIKAIESIAHRYLAGGMEKGFNNAVKKIKLYDRELFRQSREYPDLERHYMTLVEVLDLYNPNEDRDE